MVEDGGVTREELLFMQLVSMFQVAAMQQMGKLVNPITNEVETDLDAAKVSIDTLDVLRKKTQGNLAGAEQELLDKILFELHMNYVDEIKREPGQDEAEAGETDAAAAGQDDTAHAEQAADGDADDSTADKKSDEQK